MNILTFVLIAIVTSPLLLGYFSYWIFLPSTTVAIPILLEWITGVPWIVFWYVFALILSTIVSITIFIGNRIWNPIKRSERLDKKLYDNRKSVDDLKDDHWLWIFIATVIGGLVTVVWKLTGKLVFTLFSKDSTFSIAGQKATLTDTQIIIFYVFLITIGYFVAFMMAYTVYKRASGKKNWIELYKARHPSKREQFVRWFVYTSLLTFYWVYSMAIPSSFLYANEVMKGILVAMTITFVATIAGKLSTLKPR
jgi:hypothetical protein